MPVSAGYVAREATTNLWRNRLMTVAAVLTVAVSLALVGSALLLKQETTNATSQWQNGVNVRVWVNPDASSTQIKSIGTGLGQNPLVKSCVSLAGLRLQRSQAHGGGRRVQRHHPI